MSNFEPRIDFEESWNYVEKRIKKVLDNLECLPNTHLSSEDNIMIYTDIYNMGFMHNSFVYDKYKEVIYDYIISTVLPSLEGKKDEVLLRELLRRWSNHKTMTNCLSKFFLHLELKYIPRTILPSLQETSFLSFYNLVYDRLHTQVMDAILAMIDRKLVGDAIDGTLVNNILVFYSEIGEKTRKEEPKQFAETMMMKANETFYMHVEASD
ncbi:unnamed protein product [Vicia faba]|uniref:Cullin N-terminal domain-containing protein n=1 Tax=Vicia faba TaxID=3906 RepID=A0AAV1AJF0_VICFA|nr:unnamed protein product [Vicia faba]